MSVHPFSPAGRAEALERMAREEFDLLVVGGGITGCGLARDAALRGLRVALVEGHDFGYGTSSRSSKLVHGGVRYLAYGDLALVREAARERKVLRAIAPHLVHPLPFIFPLYAGDSMAKYRAGFFLFDRLAGVTEAEAHRVLSAQEVREAAPGLRDPLKGGVLYGEYVTEDGRFTLENGLSAALHGAAVANHAQAVAFRRAGDRVAGARLRDQLTGREFDVSARLVVNATGPWAEQTLAAGRLRSPKRLLLSKGIHLLFPAARIPLEGAVALKSSSGAEGFAIRRWDYVYAGTTDLPHAGEIDRPVADRAAILQVVEMVRDCFPTQDLTEADVVSVWAGLRPLIQAGRKAPRDTSRHDEVWKVCDGLLTIAGGKLTTYRPMAGRVMKHVGRELRRDLGDNRRTAEVPLPGGDLGGREFHAFQQEMADAFLGRGVRAEAARRITWLYGTAARELLRMGEEDAAWLEPLAPGFPALRGEVRLAVQQEMALRLDDFMDRRAALLIFSEDHGLAAVEAVSRIMADLLDWSEADRAAQVEEYRLWAGRHGVTGRAVESCRVSP